MNVKDCLEKGLLKKESPSRSNAIKSLENASLKLGKAKKLLELEILDMAEVNCYSSMFHASRALLFRDGYREKSHYAIYIYLKEKYFDKIEPRFLNELNTLRMERHEIFYGLDEEKFDKKQIGKQLLIAEDFIRSIRHILK